MKNVAKKDWDADLNPWVKLAAAIIEQAVRDYVDTLEAMYRLANEGKPYPVALEDAYEMNRAFFTDGRFEIYAQEINGVDLLERIDAYAAEVVESGFLDKGNQSLFIGIRELRDTHRKEVA